MKREQLDYPAITTIPEYKAERDKLDRFRGEMTKAEQDESRLHSEWTQWKQARNHLSEHEIVATAELLLAGKPARDFEQELRANQDLRDALRRAIVSQEGILQNLLSELSIKAAARFSAEHKTRSRRIVAALKELHSANVAEISLRESLAGLGFKERLPAMAFCPSGAPLDPHDKFGGYAPAWYKDAAHYCQEDEDQGGGSSLAATHDGRRPALVSTPVRVAPGAGQRSPRVATTASSPSRRVECEPFEDEE